jgi:hypothetical protein
VFPRPSLSRPLSRPLSLALSLSLQPPLSLASRPVAIRTPIVPIDVLRAAYSTRHVRSVTHAAPQRSCACAAEACAQTRQSAAVAIAHAQRAEVAAEAAEQASATRAATMAVETAKLREVQAEIYSWCAAQLLISSPAHSALSIATHTADAAILYMQRARRLYTPCLRALVLRSRAARVQHGCAPARTACPRTPST